MNPQRYLTAAGLGSRRQCDALIKAGRVTVNGRPLAFGTDIGPDDDVRVDGQRVRAVEAQVYLMLNKPLGYISDRGSRLHPSALDLIALPQPVHGLHAVGRLDQDATGLLLITNDGELSYQLTHPGFEHEKEYRVRVQGVPSDAALERWREGVMLHGEDRPTAPAHVRIVPPGPGRGDAGVCTLAVTLREGRKRQIKRVAKAIGHPVVALARVRLGPLQLGGLKPGEWRHLTPREIDELKHGTQQHSAARRRAGARRD